MTPDLEGLGADVEAGQAGDAAGRRQIGGQDPHGGRLAGSVEAQQSDNLSPVDAEADPIHGQHRPEILGEVLDVDHGSSCESAAAKLYATRVDFIPTVAN